MIIETKNGDTVQEIRLAHMGAGDLIKRKPDAKAVYVVNFREAGGDYYSLSKYDDMNSEIFLSEDTLVYTGFEF